MTTLVCDTADEAQCREAIAWTVDRFGALDILVNNAAIQPKESYVPLHELPAEVWNRLLAVDGGLGAFASFATPYPMPGD